jgi:hypothetical protein
MAKNTIGTAPFPPVLVLDKNEPLSDVDLQEALRGRFNGLSLCLRYETGPIKRGGYFFHIKPPQDEVGLYSVYDFERRLLTSLEFEALLRFVNHCTGRKFDENSFNLCATQLNFLTDD